MLDDAEWAHGYTTRLGLVSVDYATPARAEGQHHFYAATARADTAERSPRATDPPGRPDLGRTCSFVTRQVRSTS